MTFEDPFQLIPLYENPAQRGAPSPGRCGGGRQGEMRERDKRGDTAGAGGTEGEAPRAKPEDAADCRPPTEINDGMMERHLPAQRVGDVPRSARSPLQALINLQARTPFFVQFTFMPFSVERNAVSHSYSKTQPIFPASLSPKMKAKDHSACKPSRKHPIQNIVIELLYF